MVILHGGRTVLPADLPAEMRPIEPVVGPSGCGESSPVAGLAEAFDPGLDFKKARAVFEAQYLAAKLHECGGNITRLAETIGLERSYLHRKLKSYNIQSSE